MSPPEFEHSGIPAPTLRSYPLSCSAPRGQVAHCPPGYTNSPLSPSFLDVHSVSLRAVHCLSVGHTGSGKARDLPTQRSAEVMVRCQREVWSQRGVLERAALQLSVISSPSQSHGEVGVFQIRMSLKKGGGRSDRSPGYAWGWGCVHESS